MADAAMASDLEDLLDHIAWTDVLRPELLKSKTALTNRLTKAVLGGVAAGEQKAEQLAGMIYGIDILISTVERILRNGAIAARELNQQGFDL